MESLEFWNQLQKKIEEKGGTVKFCKEMKSCDVQIKFSDSQMNASLFYSQSEKYIVLAKMKATKEGNGAGTKLMNILCSVSDRSLTPIMLYPMNPNEERKNRLKGFYLRHGFKPMREHVDPEYLYSPCKHKI